MGVKPLTVAIVAAALFAITIGVDATMNRVYGLDVETQEGWREIGIAPMTREYYGSFSSEVTANASDNVRFRLRVDNDHLLPVQETYRVYANGLEVASGEIAVERGGEGEVVFSVPASRFLSQMGPRPTGETAFANLEVRVGNEHLYGNFGIREVRAE